MDLHMSDEQHTPLLGTLILVSVTCGCQAVSMGRFFFDKLPAPNIGPYDRWIADDLCMPSPSHLQPTVRKDCAAALGMKRTSLLIRKTLLFPSGPILPSLSRSIESPRSKLGEEGLDPANKGDMPREYGGLSGRTEICF